ncbi:aldose epimerase family protein [Clostridium thermobutyricum]|uniref:aldose epimerase family protein n=1 Tax=Clostridium thermobutyricum TaxID=29372 RepID=UPI0029438E68|nr:aldose epimerase family protein [Clostridium thermobutyricum]
MKLKRESIGKLRNEEIIKYSVDNEKGLKVSILNLGATITEIKTIDRNGEFGHIVLSYEDEKNYIENPSYYGATVGRTAGRIDKGRFTLNDNEYILNKNYGVNSGHGGSVGFNKKIWNVNAIETEEKITLEFSYLSKDLEEGYPGNLEIKVSYEITEDNKLIFKIQGVSDKDTLMNITNHCYFNLSGDYKEDILNHTLKMNCDRFLAIDENGGVTGEIIPVSNTEFDFIEEKKIGQDIEGSSKQMKLGYGYDHPFMFNENEKGNVELYDEKSGRYMKVTTEYPCVVVYSQNFIDGLVLKEGKETKKRNGICLEVQYPPIGYNESFKEFSILKAREIFNKETIYEFGVK